MTDGVRGVGKDARPGHRKAKRLLEAEAYRRIVAGNAPQTLSEFAAQLSAWFTDTFPAAPPVAANLVEDAIRDIWHRRHETIGSEL